FAHSHSSKPPTHYYYYFPNYPPSPAISHHTTTIIGYRPRHHPIISSRLHLIVFHLVDVPSKNKKKKDDVLLNGSGSNKFTEAVALFNGRDYHGCHDLLEAIWNDSEDPTRSLVHGILQCAVGFHHLFNQNHKGAMMEIGEGLCKLRKLNFENGPFHRFERDVSAVLEFIYQTQLEFAACNDDMCVAMDQSETSYKLLGGYGAGQHLYWLEMDESASLFIVFCPDRSVTSAHQPRVKLPILYASQEHLMELDV
ncbi:uncharacterized protein LOC143583389, partial [Bidens hawaiensis]|uniref:uncharacterized protein LOC143583389 n=1 Tax=Bidens hawaiensis TaxID=980011 RepID=UPI004049C806